MRGFTEINPQTIDLVPLPLAVGAGHTPDPDRPVMLQQHPAYGIAISGFGPSVEWLRVDLDGKPVGYVMLQSRRMFGLIRLATMLGGPVWLSDAGHRNTPLTLAVMKKLSQRHRKWRWHFLTQMPDLEDGPSETKALRRAGFKRVVSPYTSIWVDLQQEKEGLLKQMSGKWRNQLKKAEKSGLDISVGGRKPHQYAWLLEKEAAQRSNRGYAALPLGFVPRYIQAFSRQQDAVLSLTAIHGRTKIAGALVLLHGNSATYHIGWTGEEGRAFSALNLVLFQAMEELKKRHIHFLDLGGINTADGAGIARFKLGTGGKLYTYSGTWL